MFTLSEKFKAAIQRVLGTSVEAMRDMDFDEEVAFVQARKGKELKFATDERLIPRGNPYLASGRIITPEELDEKLGKIK